MNIPKRASRHQSIRSSPRTASGRAGAGAAPSPCELHAAAARAPAVRSARIMRASLHADARDPDGAAVGAELHRLASAVDAGAEHVAFRGLLLGFGRPVVAHGAEARLGVELAGEVVGKLE